MLNKRASVFGIIAVVGVVLTLVGCQTPEKSATLSLEADSAPATVTLTLSSGKWVKNITPFEVISWFTANKTVTGVEEILPAEPEKVLTIKFSGTEAGVVQLKTDSATLTAIKKKTTGITGDLTLDTNEPIILTLP
ncbi:hypothetical protein FACS1894164_17850 [Spirochaetia bacterium]|nr:hypothetical protein FACS1894164_17850 [Spirochaetia bacterium]